MMKKIVFVLLLIGILQLSAMAQVFTPIAASFSNPNNYTVSLPQDASPWLIPNDGLTTPPAQGTAASIVFIEFGDGTFSFLPNGVHDFYLPLPTSGYQITTKTSSIYTGGGKPPNYQVARFSPNPTNPVAYVPMNSLPMGEKLAITPNIGTVLAKDTMIFVVTYKSSETASSIPVRPNNGPATDIPTNLPEVNFTNPASEGTLLFFFNENNSAPVFETVSVRESMTDVVTQVQSFFVRTYSGESEISVSAATSNAQTVKGQYNILYRNCLVIKDLKLDGREHNIFITLIPKDGLSDASQSSTIIKAVMVLEKQGVPTENIEKDLSLPAGVLSHDPNYITVKPNCMLLPKAGKELKYHLHFQNTGLGDASKVIVAVKVPNGTNFTYDIDQISYKFQIDNGLLNSSPPYINQTNDSLVFEFIPKANFDPSDPYRNSGHCTLEGLKATPTNLCNPKTMGDIWFTINTTSQMPDILLAQASIVFYNPPGSPIPANKPILTNTAVSQFRECCDCKKSCDPCKNKKGFWRWLFCKKC